MIFVTLVKCLHNKTGLEKIRKSGFELTFLILSATQN